MSRRPDEPGFEPHSRPRVTPFGVGSVETLTGGSSHYSVFKEMFIEREELSAGAGGIRPGP